jgi:ribose transport system substrate-binding protein
MVEHFRYELEQHPEIATYHETDANDDPSKQISDTEDLLTRGCDILILSPATADALTPIAQTAMDQGVPVVTLDRNVSDESAYVSYVTSSNCDMGTTQAEWLIDTLGNEGSVVLLAGLAGASPAEERLSCARETIEASNLEILAENYTDWSPVEGKRIMEGWLTTFGDEIDGVWAGSGLQASGAVEAFVEAGLEVPPITGEDFNRYFKLWDDIGFEGISVSFPVSMGRDAVLVALDILAGIPVPAVVDVERTVVTIDNLDQYVRQDLPDDYWADSDPEVAARLFP